MLKRSLAVVVGVCALTTTGCTANDKNGTDGAALTVDMSNLVAEAEQSGASDAELTVLESALANNSLSFDDLEAQFLLGVDCLEDAGFTVIVDPPEELYPGLLHPAMRYQDPPGMSQDAASKLSQTCNVKNFAAVDTFYMGQPVAIDAYLATFETQRDFIVECLKDRGITVEPGSSPTELLYAVSDEQSSPAGSERPPCYQGGVFNGYARP